MSKTEKIIFILIVTGIISLLFWMFPYQIIRYNLLPEHQVHIEWTVYTASGPMDYQGTYRMKGHNFRSDYRSNRGSNTVCIEDDDSEFYVGDTRICIYVGTNDVYVNKIEVVE